MASSWGGAKDLSLGDFLKVLDPVDDDPTDDEQAPLTPEEQRALFGFNPINRKEDSEHVEQPGPLGGAARP